MHQASFMHIYEAVKIHISRFVHSYSSAFACVSILWVDDEMLCSLLSPLAVPCRHRRCPAKWSCGCSHSAPRRDGWLCLGLEGPPVDNTNTGRERENLIQYSAKKSTLIFFNWKDEQIIRSAKRTVTVKQASFLWGTIRPTEKTSKRAEKSKKSPLNKWTVSTLVFSLKASNSHSGTKAMSASSQNEGCQ